MEPLSLRKSLRFRVLNAARYAWDRALLSASAEAGKHLLIVSDDRSYTSEQQLAPFWRYRGELRHKLNLAVNHQLVEDVLAGLPGSVAGYDVILVKLDFRTTPQEAQRIVDAIATAKAGAKLIYADGDDDAAVQWPGVLGRVDVYLKSQVFADASWYERRFIGKNNLTDYVARNFGVSFESDPRPTAGPIPGELIAKIQVAWNLALGDPIARLYRQSQQPEGGEMRGHDVVCRSTVPKGWTAPLRQPALEAIGQLSGRCRVLNSSQRVAPARYYAEMRDSRICVSPFGYGEVCWRDFEAILCGCLLVKPDMSHLRTEPNVFVAGETYVPVRWDYSDLEEVCLRYLEDAEARRRIVERAYGVLDDYLSSGGFVGRVQSLLGFQST